MWKKNSLVLFTLLLAACGPRPPVPTPTASANQLQQEEQAVYAAVVKDLFPNANSIVLMETTSTDPGGVANTASTADYAARNLPGLAKATVENFKTRNAQSYNLSVDMQLGVQYVLLTQKQRNEIFGQNQSGWETFYQNYPNAPGITDLSRVGFNPSFDQALVYAGTLSNYLAGSGYYLLLVKTNGTWTVSQKVMTWIS